MVYFFTPLPFAVVDLRLDPLDIKHQENAARFLAERLQKESIQGQNKNAVTYKPLPTIEGLLPSHSDNHQGKPAVVVSPCCDLMVSSKIYLLHYNISTC